MYPKVVKDLDKHTRSNMADDYSFVKGGKLKLKGDKHKRQALKIALSPTWVKV